jgi:type IV pilus assembly protein PilM
MASGAVWGIDIGQCALKALRCRPHEDSKKLVAEAFDYIEYPKILSQPGSDPAELVGDALKQFLSRNSVIGDKVAVSVSGQAGLARFIKLPPVEAKKIPDIVRYEARQQIPFDLNDVIWDYQRMGVGSVEEGFALETEVGLFAMKRDAVFRALDPFLKLDIEVDLVQLTPLSLYNFILFDQLGALPSSEEYDPENPPESVVAISMGTDATDLVITNGFRVWQRSIPLGGSHFTKALVRDLKLTFPKAEHLKRNATAAADPKAVFQAMRPVFSDLLTELQRSIGFFSNLDRAAKIGRVVALGNAMKLPGLRRYLSQSLGLEIEKLDSFCNLTGPQVVAAPTFQENLLSFSVCYGLTLQGLGKGGVYTNLLPREIVQDRLIRRKKPWAVAAAAIILLGLTLGFGFRAYALRDVNQENWEQAERKATATSGEAKRVKGEADSVLSEFNNIDEIGKHLTINADGRFRWLELLKAISTCLPTGEDPPPKGPPKDNEGKETKLSAAEQSAQRISLRRDLHITSLECEQSDDVQHWFHTIKKYIEDAGGGSEGKEAGASLPAAPAAGLGTAPGKSQLVEPEKKEGWIIHIYGYHFHNLDRDNQGAEYLRRTLIKHLAGKTDNDDELKIELPSENGKMEPVSLQDLSILYPVIVPPAHDSSNSGMSGVEHKITDYEIPDPNLEPPTGGPMGGPAGGGMMPGMGGGMPYPGMGGGMMPGMGGGMPYPGMGGGMPMPGMGGGMPMPGMGGGMPRSPTPGSIPGGSTVRLKIFPFEVQFLWQPKTFSERRAAAEKRAKEKAGSAPTTPELK